MKIPGAWPAAAFSLLLHGALVLLFSDVKVSGSWSAGAPGKEILTVTLEGQSPPAPPALPQVLPKPPVSPSPDSAPQSQGAEDPYQEFPDTGTREGEGLSFPGLPPGLDPSPDPERRMNFRLSPDFRPEYPLLARKRRWEGAVKFQVELDREGVLTLLELKESSGHALLDEAGRRALETAEFLPGAPGRGTVEIVFRLE